MHGLYIEKRSIDGKTFLSWDLAHHIFSRGAQYKIVVVTEGPAGIMAATRKQWLKLVRQVKHERSGTLNASKIMELSGQILWMEKLSFTCREPKDGLDADVTFAAAGALLQLPLVCSSIYLTQSYDEVIVQRLTSCMTEEGVVVVYG
ncbi:MAG TPA: hypothetical protein VMR45_04890 [Patescibacteria group bacterium]|nr:hypothetical protein [Patescibacteria group bacterium]